MFDKNNDFCIVVEEEEDDEPIRKVPSRSAKAIPVKEAVLEEVELEEEQPKKRGRGRPKASSAAPAVTAATPVEKKSS